MDLVIDVLFSRTSVDNIQRNYVSSEHSGKESESTLRTRSEQHHAAAVWFNEAVENGKYASFTLDSSLRDL